MKKVLFLLSLVLVLFTTGCMGESTYDGVLSDPSPKSGVPEGGYEITTTDGLSTYTTEDGVSVTYGYEGTDSVLRSEYTDGSSVETVYGESTITVTTTSKDGTTYTSIYDVPPAGILTASEWNDLDNYEFFLSLFELNQQHEKGIFSLFYNDQYFDALKRIKVNVDNGTETLQGVLVELIDENNDVLFASVTNVNGEAYLFPHSTIEGILKIRTTYLDVVSSTNFDLMLEDREVSFTIGKESTKSNLIEIMFVIDATGSMRDELEFLQSEIDDVLAKVYEEIPTADIKLALLFYKDDQDDYITKYFDFSSDIEGQMIQMRAQSASGGGDFPEAVDIAMDEAVNKQWSSLNSTKLLFHVLDAPPHTTVHEDMVRYSNSVKMAAEKGIRIIPIASSGIDKETEYLLRNSAIYTGGTYLYLTNDSGVGGEHIEATTGDDVVVEYLNLCLIRIIKEYYTGEEITPVPYNPEQ